MQREMSNAKSPLFSHFSAAFNGIVSIRAYGAQQKFRVEAQRRADKYTRAATAVSIIVYSRLTHLAYVLHAAAQFVVSYL